MYELSADVCAGGDNRAELLKCLERLVTNLYPAAAGAGAGAVLRSPDPSGGVAASQQEACGSGRQDEVQAALLLYFAAVPRRMQQHALAHQLAAAAAEGQLAGSCMQVALAAVRCLAGSDYVGFFRVQADAPASAGLLAYMLRIGADKARL